MLFFGGAFIDGLWLGFLGWFLLSGAQAANVQATLQRLFKDVRGRDGMNPHPATVSVTITLGCATRFCMAELNSPLEKTSRHRPRHLSSLQAHATARCAISSRFFLFLGALLETRNSLLMAILEEDKSLFGGGVEWKTNRSPLSRRSLTLTRWLLICGTRKTGGAHNGKTCSFSLR